MGLDAVLEPVGPLPPRVYWVRRGVLIVGLIIFLLIVKSCAGGGGKKHGAGGSISASGPSASAAAGSPSPSPAAVSVPDTATPCVDTQLSLAVTANGTTFPSGAPAQLTIVVTNNGATACTKDVSNAQFGFIVSSGGVRTWSSTDCQSPQPNVVTLKAKENRTLTLPWNRHWSDAACNATTSARIATIGTYTVKGVLGSTLAKDGPVISLRN